MPLCCYRWPKNQGSIPCRGERFTFIHTVQIITVDYQTSYQLDIACSSPGSKAGAVWTWPASSCSDKRGSELHFISAMGYHHSERDKFLLVHATKAYCGGRSIALYIINLGDKWKEVADITSRPVYPRERRLVRMNKRLAEPHSWSGRLGEEKNLLPLADVLVIYLLQVK